MTAPPDTRLTTIFSKRPVPGRVKTRLTPPLSADQAAGLALAMLDDAVASHARCAEYATELVVTPADELPWFRERYPSVRAVAAQEGSGLGERMARWFAGRCDGVRSVVIVGSDCPLLMPATVARAHALLEGAGAETADVVFAPDSGGGYVLVGMRRAQPDLFRDVPMSTDDMFERTCAAARARGLRLALLPEHYDVDVEADLQRLGRDLRRMSGRGGSDAAGFPGRTLALLNELPPTVQ